MILKKLILLSFSAMLTFGFTACSNDDDGYITMAQRTADKIRSLGIKNAYITFNNLYENSRDGNYDIAIDGDFLVLTKKTDNWSYKIHIPLDAVKEIMNLSGYYYIYLY